MTTFWSKVKRRNGLSLCFMGAVLALWLGAYGVWEGAPHKGKGMILVGGPGPDYAGHETEEHWDPVSERVYRRDCYLRGTIFLSICCMLIWHAAGNWRERDGREKHWDSLLSDPEKRGDMEKHPERYRDDLIEYLKQTRSDKPPPPSHTG